MNKCVGCCKTTFFHIASIKAKVAFYNFVAFIFESFTNLVASQEVCEEMALNLACLFIVCFVGVNAQYGGFLTPPRSGPKKATCVVNNDDVQGTINLSQSSVTAPVTVSGEIRGLSPGLHGFHVHEFGDLSNGCASAGGHYNPYGKNHGAPSDEERHVGDLGNIVAENSGVAQLDISDYQLKLCGPHSILGRAIVIHALPDDLGRGGNAESLRTGNAGARVGCCVIGSARNS